MTGGVLQAQLAETPRTAAFLSPSERQWLQDRQDAARSVIQEKGSDPRAMGAPLATFSCAVLSLSTTQLSFKTLTAIVRQVVPVFTQAAMPPFEPCGVV